jgi:hypothetical protein
MMTRICIHEDNDSIRTTLPITRLDPRDIAIILTIYC